MEMDELKNMWSMMDEKLNKQEILNNNIIRETLKSKSTKYLSLLINYNYFALILCLVGIILIISRLTTMYFGIYKTIIFILAIIFLVMGFVLTTRNVLILQKIDFTKKISENIRLTRSLKLAFKQSSIYGYIGAIILILSVFIALIIDDNMEVWRWALIIGVVIMGLVLCVWEYKRIYKASINSILESFEKLKELEEK